MSVDIIQEKLRRYQCQTVLDQENALKEIAQEIALMALSRADFFKIAAFHGGTCLRILYGLQRFSEDLDFALIKPDKQFLWQDYVKNMQEEFHAYGYTLEVEDKATLEKAVRVAFLKADSAGGMLIISDSRTNRPKIKIKLEVDTNPPVGANYELKFLDFPLPYSVKTHDMASLFAGKCHALLCRDYVKGRDWFDFIWYVSREASINFSLLTNAIEQAGPFAGKSIHVDAAWFLKELSAKIKTIDWHAAKQDVARFLKPRELDSLDVWSKEFFLSRVEKLGGYL